MDEPGVRRGNAGWGKLKRSICHGAFVALACGVVHGGLRACAQAIVAGSIEGKITDAYSRPLDGIRVTLRNMRTGAEFTATTAKAGVYRLTGLVPGEYVLDAWSAQLGISRTAGIIIPSGHAARVQTALRFHRDLPGDRNAPPELALAPPPIPASPVPEPARNLAGAIPAPALPVADRPIRTQSGALLIAVASADLVSALQLHAVNARRPAEEQPVPDPLQPALQVTIAGEDLEALPLEARGAEAFRLDAPPQVPADAGAGLSQDVALEAGDRNPSRVDGMSTRLAFGRGSGRRDPGAFIGPAATDATIREVQMVSRFGVDASGFPGREGGGVFTRSGADFGRGRLHGQVFLFDSQNLLNARNPFSQWVRETAPAASGALPVFGSEPWSPADTSIRWGATAGGPLRRDRLFWYAAFRQDRRTDPAMAVLRHPDNFFATPSNDEMQVLSARLDLPSADPVGEGLAAYSGMLETLAGLLGPVTRSSARSTAFVRFDGKAGQRHRFQLEASALQWNAPGGGFSRVTESYGNHSFAAVRSSDTWLMAAWDASLAPNLVSVTQGAFTHYSLQHPAAQPSAFEQSLNVNPWGQLPQMVVDSRYGFSIGNPARFGAGTYPQETQLEARETVSWTRGRIVFLAGAEFEHAADATSLLRNHTGTYHYSRIENFASDALVFSQFGLSDALDPHSQHNCDQRGKAWRDSEGRLHGLGYLPCYSCYTQTLGPVNWHLQTDDWAGFATTAWRARPGLTISAGVRWDREIMPPPIAAIQNPDLPDAGKLPNPGNEWAPRVGIAIGSHESRLPVLSLGYGVYYGRIQNRTLEDALTQTGSPNADLKLFLRPTDNLAPGAGGAPPFPYVMAGSPGTALKPGASQVAPGFRNGEVQQAIAMAEQRLPARMNLSVAAVAGLGRRLPITMDTNFDPAANPGTITYEVMDPSKAGPVKTSQLTVPFYAVWPSAGQSGGRFYPGYQEVTTLFSRANSTYEAAVMRLSRSASRGISFHLRYTYSHAMDWNPNESGFLTGGDVLDPLDMRQEYGTSNLDIRHSASGYVVWRAPWKFTQLAGKIANGWMLSGIGQFHSGLPYSMRTEGAIPAVDQGGGLVVGLGPGITGYGGANRVWGVGRNTYRYPSTGKADVRLGKRFALGRQRELELLAQTFNLLNHRNVTELETVGYTIDTPATPGSLPRLKFLINSTTGLPEFGLPLNIDATDLYRERQVEFGLRLRFKH